MFLIHIYTDKEIELLAASGKILSEVLRQVASLVKPGVSAFELDKKAEGLIRASGAVPAFLGYSQRGSRPYPASLCVSVNEELVHCVPYKDKVLQEGDIASLDLGVQFMGYFTDMATTVPVGKTSPLAAKLLQAAYDSLEAAIKLIHSGLRMGDLGATIEKFAIQAGFGVVRDLVGHGVGKTVHEDPKIPNYGIPGTGLRLKQGMVLAIEPMFTMGSHKIRMLPDGWGIATADGGLAAHFEKTVAVSADGCQALTP